MQDYVKNIFNRSKDKLERVGKGPTRKDNIGRNYYVPSDYTSDYTEFVDDRHLMRSVHTGLFACTVSNPFLEFCDELEGLPPEKLYEQFGEELAEKFSDIAWNESDSSCKQVFDALKDANQKGIYDKNDFALWMMREMFSSKALDYYRNAKSYYESTHDYVSRIDVPEDFLEEDWDKHSWSFLIAQSIFEEFGMDLEEEEVKKLFDQRVAEKAKEYKTDIEDSLRAATSIDKRKSIAKKKIEEMNGREILDD